MARGCEQLPWGGIAVRLLGARRDGGRCEGGAFAVLGWRSGVTDRHAAEAKPLTVVGDHLAGELRLRLENCCPSAYGLLVVGFA